MDNNTFRQLRRNIARMFWSLRKLRRTMGCGHE